MSENVIEIRDLSKQYRLGKVGTGTISHDLNRWWAKIRGKEDPYATVGQINRRDQKAESDYVWALKDINLDVKRGEVLGIIGGNGAGKSTLLKLISRITSPTTGHICAKGRIASLLEVGTGMHPEMTARENIYLNGAILGMRRHEIKRKFDDIIDFAGCQMYVDTPVKRYSSGMRVRLGFAVAAFLEPEILIVDEVLAVGDAEFQERCMSKISKIAGDGSTVLFVSHNMAAIETLCSRAVVLKNGSTYHNGTVTDAIVKYSQTNGRYSTDIYTARPTKATADGVITQAGVQSKDSNIAEHKFTPSCSLEFWVTIHCQRPLYNPSVGIGIENRRGARVYTLHTKCAHGDKIPNIISGETQFKCQANGVSLTPGPYNVRISLEEGGTVIDSVSSAFTFEIIRTRFFENPGASVGGVVLAQQYWQHELLEMNQKQNC